MAGYIAARNIMSGYITARYIAAGYITAGCITAGFIAAGYITAGYITVGHIIVRYSTPSWRRKLPYLDTCKTKISVDYHIRKLSARSTTHIPLALSKIHNMLSYVKSCIYIYISIHVFFFVALFVFMNESTN